ncbi:uncharacterized protein LOC141652068 [Silene latifolia]|uniref:uncharacterized protein LOC141652068 n=1 Tax=Silene latifolia TaxID=37657 RepID=UPI003D785D92
MERGVKRSLDQVEESSVPTYEFSDNEIYNLQNSAKERPMFNDIDKFDLNNKMTALKASPFVVSLVSFTGEEVVSQSCGAIIEAEGNTYTVLTSLHLARKPASSVAHYVENSLADDLKIVINAYDDKSYLGEFFCYDFYFNLLVIKFRSNNVFPSTNFMMIDDDSGMERRISLCRHPTKAKTGDSVIVVGRYFYEPYTFMAASGLLSLQRFDHESYDCNELLTISCRFNRCGDGAPVISCSGEMIGIAFYHLGRCSPILPINIVQRWWCHFKSHREFRHPIYGFDGRNLYLTSLPTLEKFLKNFPNISSGVIVEKVFKSYCAETAGLRVNDVIYKCDGEEVKGFFEIWNLMWDKLGKVVEFEVARLEPKTILSIRMLVSEASPEESNDWPKYNYR